MSFAIGSRPIQVVLGLPLFWGVLTSASLALAGVISDEILWLVRMLCFVPAWFWIRRIGIMNSHPVSSKIWLMFAYTSAFAVVLGPDLGFFSRATFGVIVSPIFEELFCRLPLSLEFHRRWWRRVLILVISSGSFALLHWFYLADFGAALSPLENLEKFGMHFVFGAGMGALYMVTKRIEVPIVVHMISNLRWVPHA